MNKLSIVAVLGCVVAYAVHHTASAMPSLSFDMPVGALPLSGWLFFGGVLAFFVVLVSAMDYISKAVHRQMTAFGPIALVILVIAFIAMAVVK